jgi:hypothetical protein
MVTIINVNSENKVYMLLCNVSNHLQDYSVTIQTSSSNNDDDDKETSCSMMFIHAENTVLATTNYITNKHEVQVTMTLHELAVLTHTLFHGCMTTFRECSMAKSKKVHMKWVPKPFISDIQTDV